ncbi:DNA gyrase C-terminal beta-propeller domain-containing protein, partial [Lactiplantibacillus plantarum]|uniref:DNA gyrase C-terminal beta-propeller domain-containing protein n=1 Tax=Lactiplantibacillus plantarum TaxID=1590 RepID=UPI001102DCF5
GTVKRTPVSDFANIRSNGLIAIHLKEGDQLINALIIDQNQNVIIGTHLGYAMSFNASDVRSMGRSATGVRGIRLRENDYVVGADVLNPDSEVFIISEKGFGKRTPAADYPIKGRGGNGVKTAKITEKNGPLSGLTTVSGNEDIMLITDKGVMSRFGIEDVSQTGRSTLGVHLIRIDEDSKVSTMAKVEKQEDEASSDASKGNLMSSNGDTSEDSDSTN